MAALEPHSWVQTTATCLCIISGKLLQLSVSQLRHNYLDS